MVATHTMTIAMRIFGTKSKPMPVVSAGTDAVNVPKNAAGSSPHALLKLKMKYHADHARIAA